MSFSAFGRLPSARMICKPRKTRSARVKGQRQAADKRDSLNRLQMTLKSQLTVPSQSKLVPLSSWMKEPAQQATVAGSPPEISLGLLSEVATMVMMTANGPKLASASARHGRGRKTYSRRSNSNWRRQTSS